MAVLFVLVPFLLGDRPAWVIAVAEPNSSDPVSLLIGYGPLGIFLVLLATGQFRTKYEVHRAEAQVDRLTDDIKHLRAENAAQAELIRAFQMQLTGHTLPALAQSARVFEAVPTAETEALTQMRTVLADLTQQIESLGKGEKP